VDSDVSNWDVGYFQEVGMAWGVRVWCNSNDSFLASLVGGNFFKQVMTFVAMISTLGSFNALLFTTYAFIPFLDLYDAESTDRNNWLH
jgi:hypothetical protein